jgi:hypothetical protein
MLKQRDEIMIRSNRIMILVNLVGMKAARQIIWRAVFLRLYIFIPDRTSGISP